MARNSVHSVQDILNVAEQNGVPLEHIRFFIGQDYKGARAFGVYQDPNTLEWVVYKNKDDGSRAERYRGFDEEFAAQEIWEKLEAEIVKREQKYNGALGPSVPANSGNRNYSPAPHAQSTQDKIGTAIAVGIVAIIVFALISSAIKGYRNKKHNGYYRNNDSTYYYQDGDWYYFDDDDDYWVPYYGVEDNDAWFDDYYQGRSYDMGDDSNYFDNSGYYDDSSDSSWWGSDDSSWDSDSDWGDWDSGDTDWGSDW